MICPKCGFEQPDNPECARCGVIVSRYKGPALGASALRPPVVSPENPPAAAFGVPEPVAAMAGGGTIYNGPPPGSAAAAAMAAPQTLAQPQGTLGVGDVLGQTFSIFFANLLPFVLLTAVAMSPLYLLQGYTNAVAKASPTPSPQTLVLLLPLLLAAVVCPYIATGAITYGVFQQLRGQDTTIGDCLGRGLTVLLPVVGLAIVQGFAVFLGLMVCLIPGLLLALRWAVAVPTMVTERTGIFDSMNRSKFLTEGSRGEVFGVLFVLGILQIGTTLIVTRATMGNPTLRLALSAAKDMFVVGLSATGAAVMYYRLRSLRESIDVDQIASVFA